MKKQDSFAQNRDRGLRNIFAAEYMLNKRSIHIFMNPSHTLMK